MSLFNKLFGSKKATPQNNQAVIVYLDAAGLRDSVYEQYDLATIEDKLIGVIESGQLGEFDGNEIGEGDAVLYMYGPSAELLFAGVQSTLASYPLCSGARVVLRAGPPGAPEREVRLPPA